MSGITILNAFTATSSPSWACVSMIVGMVFLLIGIGSFLASNNFPTFVAGTIIAIIGIIVIFAGFIFSEKKSIQTTRYECVIDEDVNVNDLYDKYNIIEKRGEIWVLEEKDNDG